MKLDFSQFHPLDHWPGGAYCRSLPGGPRRHLHLAWHERWRDEITWRLWQPIQKIRCPRGHHRLTTPGYMPSRGFFKGCKHCPYWFPLEHADVPAPFRRFINQLHRDADD